MSKIQINDNSTKYAGTVKITFLDDKKQKPIIKHNAGTKELFTFIVRALSGENVIGLQPNNIMLLDDGGKNLLTTPISYDGSHVTSGLDKEDSGSLTLTFFIAGVSVKTGNVKTLQLLDANGIELATLELTGNGISINSGSSLRVDWTLTISNSSSTPSTTKTSNAPDETKDASDDTTKKEV